MMTSKTRAICTRALYERIDGLRDDVRLNADYYNRHSWRGGVHRRRAAAELREIREALRELRFLEWGTRAA